MNQPQFCKTTSLWIPKKGTGKILSEGAACLNQWRRLFSKQKKQAQDILLYSSTCLLVIFLSTYFLWEDPEEWFHNSWLVFSSAYLLAISFLQIYFGWRSRDSLLNQLLQLDLWIGFLLLAIAFEEFWTSEELRVQTTTPLCFSILGFGGFIWFQVRGLEAFLWSKKLKNHFQNSDFFWTTPDKMVLNAERYISLVGIAIALGTLKLEDSELSVSSILAASLPALLPWPQWLVTKTLSQAESFKLVCQDFSKFLKLRTADLLIFHQCGVLTSDKFEQGELWIDKNDEFTESEIKDVLRQLSQTSEHPVSKLIQSELKEHDQKLMKLESVECKENLGLVGNFEDLKRQKTSAVLAGLTWHKILQHDISEEGMEKIRGWKRDKFSTTFLSLNRKVVAAITWKNHARSNECPLTPDRPITLISSQPHLIDGIDEKSFDQVSIGLLPIERQLQKRYWEERSHHVLEIKAQWDSSQPNQPDIIMVEDRLSLREKPLGILNGDLNSALFAVKAATRFHKALQWSSIIMLMGCLMNFGFHQTPAVFLGMYFLSLIWLRRN